MICNYCERPVPEIMKEFHSCEARDAANYQGQLFAELLTENKALTAKLNKLKKYLRVLTCVTLANTAFLLLKEFLLLYFTTQ